MDLCLPLSGLEDNPLTIIINNPDSKVIMSAYHVSEGSPAVIFVTPDQGQIFVGCMTRKWQCSD